MTRERAGTPLRPLGGVQSAKREVFLSPRVHIFHRLPHCDCNGHQMHLVFVEFPPRVRHLRAPLRFDAPDDSGATRASGGRVRSSGTGPGRPRLPGGHSSVSPRHCPTTPQVRFGLASATITSPHTGHARAIGYRQAAPLEDVRPRLSSSLSTRRPLVPGRPRDPRLCETTLFACFLLLWQLLRSLLSSSSA